MGATFDIDFYGENMESMQAAAEAAFDEARRLDRMLSNYIPDSELSRLNDRAAQEPVRVSREFFVLLSSCLDYSARSNGAFDITVGPLMKVWGFYKGSGHLPHDGEVKRALESVGYRNIRLDPSNLTVRFAKPDVNLDPGGVGKGYAVDRMVAVLRQHGITCALVSGGGSSIYGLGVPPTDARGWYVAIRDPKRREENGGRSIFEERLYFHVR